VSTFRASHRLSELGRRVSRYWSDIDVLLVPTTPTIYTIEQVLAEPRSLNARLGTYTNFVNLLRSCAIAIPNGFRGDGLPTGVTLIGPESADARIIEIAKRFETSLRRETDAEAPVPASSLQAARTSPVVKGPVKLAVVGAHLSGQPLNWQLTSLGAKLVEACRTAPAYRLYALRGTNIPKPGLLRTTIDGVSIQVEVWELEASALGQFMSYVAPPLCIGTLELEDRSAVLGFLCESHALSSAEDISSFGGWRAFLEHKL
jgi:allophanate hydrolase